jgi:hypothetical protein
MDCFQKIERVAKALAAALRWSLFCVVSIN